MTTTAASSIEDLLRRTRARIADPARWMQRHFAQDARGAAVSSRSAAAVRWCVTGALDVEGRHGDASAAIRLLGGLVPDGRLAWFNDSHTHAEVLALLDAASSEAQRQGI